MNECGTFVLFIKFLFVFKNIEIWFGVIVIFKIFSLDEVFLSHPKQTFIRIYTITILCEFSAQLLCQCLHAAWLYSCLCFTTITKVNRKRLKHKLDHNRPIYNVKIMCWFWICCYLNAVSQAFCSLIYVVYCFLSYFLRSSAYLPFVESIVILRYKWKTHRIVVWYWCVLAWLCVTVSHGHAN